MRNTILAATLGALLLTSGAFAASLADLPARVRMTDGALTDALGRPLYTFDMDTMKGMSHCSARCAVVWPPFTAGAKDRPKGAWAIVIRDDGSRQWAYKDKPLYYYAQDKPGRPPAGSTVPNWKPAIP